MDRIGLRLRKLRNTAGLSQRQLAEKAFGSEKQHARIVKYENAQEIPATETVSKMLGAMGFSWQDLENVSLVSQEAFSPQDTAEMLGISDDDVRRLEELGHLKAIYIGTRPRFAKSEIDRFLDANKGKQLRLYARFPVEKVKGRVSPSQ